MAKKISSPSISISGKQIGRYIVRHHAFIAFVVIMGYMIYTVYSINSILSQTDDTTYRAEQLNKASSYNFDTETIDKIKKLKSRQQSSEVGLPSGRINPFTE